MRFFAHRFGREYGPDSTRATLAAALREPLDGLETDCCLTADGRIALLHDPLLRQGTTLDGWTYERTAADIAAARVLDRAGSVVDEHPMLLEDLWPLLAGRCLVVQLEVKAICDEDLALRTCEALCRALAATPPPLGVRIEVISFWPEVLPIAAASGWATRLIVASPYTPAALARWAVEHGVTGVILEAPFWSQRHVDVWRGAGLSLMSGVCNDVDVARRVLAFGPDVFASDRPHELRAELLASSLAPA
ncbi:hypothetical protein BH10ACT1_BH10ACT1_18280 [soil metagenome]